MAVSNLLYDFKSDQVAILKLHPIGFTPLSIWPLQVLVFSSPWYVLRSCVGRASLRDGGRAGPRILARLAMLHRIITIL